MEGFITKRAHQRPENGVLRSIAEQSRRPEPFGWRTGPETVIAGRGQGSDGLESMDYLEPFESDKQKDLALSTIICLKCECYYRVTEMDRYNGTF